MKNKIILLLTLFMLITSLPVSALAKPNAEDRETLINLFEAMIDNPESVYWDVLDLKMDTEPGNLATLQNFENILTKYVSPLTHPNLEKLVVKLKNGDASQLVYTYSAINLTHQKLVAEVLHEGIEEMAKLYSEGADLSTTILEEKSIKKGIISYAKTSIISSIINSSTIDLVVKEARKEGLSDVEIDKLLKIKQKKGLELEQEIFKLTNDYTTILKNMAKSKVFSGFDSEINDIRVYDDDAGRKFWTPWKKKDEMNIEPGETEKILLKIKGGQFVQGNSLFLLLSGDESVAEIKYIDGSPHVFAKGNQGQSTTIKVMKFGTSQVYSFDVNIEN